MRRRNAEVRIQNITDKAITQSRNLNFWILAPGFWIPFLHLNPLLSVTYNSVCPTDAILVQGDLAWVVPGYRPLSREKLRRQRVSRLRLRHRDASLTSQPQ